MVMLQSLCTHNACSYALNMEYQTLNNHILLQIYFYSLYFLDCHAVNAYQFCYKAFYVLLWIFTRFMEALTKHCISMMTCNIKHFNVFTYMFLQPFVSMYTAAIVVYKIITQ